MARAPYSQVLPINAAGYTDVTVPDGVFATLILVGEQNQAGTADWYCKLSSGDEGDVPAGRIKEIRGRFYPGLKPISLKSAAGAMNFLIEYYDEGYNSK